jgi:proline iminopeptidase
MRVQVNGVRLWFDVEGASVRAGSNGLEAKPTLILLHGGPGADHSVFKPLYSKLTEVAQVIYLDHRANGRSEHGPREQWTLAQWGEDVAAFCDALDIEKPIVLGLSFGGMVAQAYASQFPDHPAKLILLSTASVMDFDASLAAFERLGGKRARSVAQAYWSQPTSESYEAYKEVCYPLYRRYPRFAEIHGTTLNHDEVALDFHRTARTAEGFDLRPALSRISCPTLVIGGEDDPITPPVCAETIMTHLTPGVGQLKMFADAGHGVGEDGGDAYWDLLKRFITS